MKSNILAQLNGISVRVTGGPVLLHPLTLNIPRGSILALLGESGSGKTLTTLALGGLLPGGLTATGTLAWRGHHQMAQPGRDIGFVFQDPLTSFNPVMTIGEQLAETVAAHAPGPTRSWRAHWDQAVRLLDEVGLADAHAIAAAFPHQLSGGMCQRAAIAMALAGRPELLVTDECTSALDTLSQAHIVQLIRTQANLRNLSVLMVTHDLALAGMMATSVAILYAGRLVESGPITVLTRQPRHPYTAALTRLTLPVNRPPTARLPELTGYPPDPAILFPGCAFSARCPSSTNLCESRMPYWTGTVDDGFACHHPLPAQTAGEDNNGKGIA